MCTIPPIFKRCRISLLSECQLFILPSRVAFQNSTFSTQGSERSFSPGIMQTLKYTTACTRKHKTSTEQLFTPPSGSSCPIITDMKIVIGVLSKHTQRQSEKLSRRERGDMMLFDCGDKRYISKPSPLELMCNVARVV